MKTKTPQENPEFHLGQLLKAELARQGRTATWLAKQVHCIPENIYKAYRSQWISMPLLFEICKALDYDFLRRKQTNGYGFSGKQFSFIGKMS